MQNHVNNVLINSKVYRYDALSPNTKHFSAVPEARFHERRQHAIYIRHDLVARQVLDVSMIPSAYLVSIVGNLRWKVDAIHFADVLTIID